MSPPRPIESGRVQGRSAAARWARFVLGACQADGDVPTLGDWARTVGVSSATLRDACRVVKISPHDSRDLARAIRALVNSRVQGCAPDLLLDIHDIRTLQAFVERAGFVARSREMPLAEFLDSQTFVPIEHQAVKELRRLIGDFQGPVH